MDALVHDRISSKPFEFSTHMADVETLNEWALEGRLDVTKVSFHAYLKVMDHYQLLTSGAALGFGCGPLVISKEPVTEKDLNEGPVAIPGTHTTAHMLFRLRFPNAQNKRFMVFSDIESAVLEGSVRAGVIIHENRFTYQEKGLRLIEDLGTFWEHETNSPIPLGAFIAKKALGNAHITRIQELIRESVQYALDFPEDPMPYIREHAQEMNPDVMMRHIRTYVNQYSLDLGSDGLRAVQRLQAHALQAGLMR